MPIVYLVIALLASVIVHEFAHAAVMRRLGVPIVKAGIGLPVPYLTLTLPTPWGFRFTLSPLLVGAYVQADEEGEAALSALPYREQAWYLNAGIVANLLLAEALLLVEFALRGSFTGSCFAAASLLATWRLRRPIAAFLIPALALPALGFMVYAVVDTLAVGDNPMGLASAADTAEAVLSTSDPAPVLVFMTAISLAVALLNAMPLMGLDNGRVVALLLERWLPRRGVAAYKAVGYTTVLVMVVAALGSDALALARWVL